MRKMKLYRGLGWLCTLGVPLVTACSGGSNNNGDTAAYQQTALCPSSVDYGTVWTGVSGSGEVVKFQIDTTKMTWQVAFIESVVPETAGTATPNRAGTSLSGTMTQETLLPTSQLNNCTYRLNGASFDPTTPARIFVSNGVLGGELPGKEIEYPGVLGIGVIPDTTFRFFPFIAFSSLDTSLATLASRSPYTQFGFSVALTQSVKSTPIDAKVTFNADGSYIKCDTTGVYAGQCRQTGTNFVQSADGTGVFESDNYQGEINPTLALAPQGKGWLLVGKLRGQDVPILVREGAINLNPLSLAVDDEIGLSVMAPRTTIAEGSVDGEYAEIDSAIPAGGNDDQFDYRALLMTGTEATQLDPFNVPNTATTVGLNVSYAQPTPGRLGVTYQAPSSPSAAASLIFDGGVSGFLDDSNPAEPYFSVGVLLQ